jgi:processive 1,2-diacylglycerol beta-glucosyltransferase
MALRPNSLVQRRLNSLGHSSLEATLNDYCPDLVVCTHPVPAGVMARLRKSGRTRVPIATVLTDYAFHTQWLHQAVDMHFVGSDLLREDLIARGLSPLGVYATGIPIRGIFDQGVDQAEARLRLGLHPDRPTILIMGGAFGVLSHIQRLPQMLCDLGGDVQALAIAGRSRRLRRALEHEALRLGDDRLKVHGFVTHVNEFMAAADLMITKAGGITMTEALAMHLPVVIHKPIVGQEAANARFLVEAGAAAVAQDPQELQALLGELLRNPQRLAQMRQAAATLAKPQAAGNMVQIMLERVGQRQLQAS